jgi:hypothetical protein
MMGSIYAGPEQVVVWVGSARLDGDVAMDSFERIRTLAEDVGKDRVVVYVEGETYPGLAEKGSLPARAYEQDPP